MSLSEVLNANDSENVKRCFFDKKICFWNRNTFFVFGSWNMFAVCTQIVPVQNEKRFLVFNIPDGGLIECYFNEYNNQNRWNMIIIICMDAYSYSYPYHVDVSIHAYFHISIFMLILMIIFMFDGVIASNVDMLLGYFIIV